MLLVLFLVCKNTFESLPFHFIFFLKNFLFFQLLPLSSFSFIIGVFLILLTSCLYPFHFQLSSLPSSMHFYPFALQFRLKEMELNLLGSCQDFVNAYMCADAKPLPKGICEFDNVIKLSHTPAYRARPGLQLSSHTTANILFVRNAERLSPSSWSKERSYYHCTTMPATFIWFGFLPPKVTFHSKFSFSFLKLITVFYGMKIYPDLLEYLNTSIFTTPKGKRKILWQCNLSP